MVIRLFHLQVILITTAPPEVEETTSAVKVAIQVCVGKTVGMRQPGGLASQDQARRHACPFLTTLPACIWIFFK